MAAGPSSTNAGVNLSPSTMPDARHTAVPMPWVQWDRRAGASWRYTRSPAMKGSVRFANAERNRPKNGARATSQGA